MGDRAWEDSKTGEVRALGRFELGRRRRVCRESPIRLWHERFSASWPRPENAWPDRSVDLDVASGLRADLLGATLIDAQDELVAAWTTLDRRARTPRHRPEPG